ncbi:HlyD family efflux transporter periplasmic adaptor subunit [Fluviicola sp.]|jgi:multidrug efflux pump subunit AcrA (membrane-fusion protein)|uniref:HlyD family efflux transporter periplasmic adaptor subunit n=1 Tax=Fluviicola sp. TaxID=1917219 RepID=UPI00283A7294|nr:HlyD family efflux transporter periplasmic adaptor subunit [Fluviicola sp.]MDR0803256.1 HlyD family secretion protein [Fluviicola sp.]
MKKEVNNDIELRSEPMNEVLAHPPKWIVRSGNGLLLIIIVTIFSLARFIQYPDEIAGDVIVTTTKAPIELSNQSYIQLKSLNVSENQIVKNGELIAQFDVQAKSKDIEKAKKYLNQIKDLKGQISLFNGELQLGIFQEQWLTLLSKIREWNNEKSENITYQELASIKREISFREQLQAISSKKIKLSEGEYELIQEQLEGSERLAEQNAISRQTLTQDKRTHTQSLQSVQVQKEQHVQNLIVLNTLRKECLRLEHDAKLKELQEFSEIQIGITSLLNGFNTWEKSAVWVAPCSGKVLFNKILQVNCFYKANEASVVVVPNGSGYNAIATITTTGAGKVRAGQKVFIELTDYPRSEFGTLEGIVNDITQIDKEGKYEVKIQLANQLKTTYGKQIPCKAQFKGTARIITRNKRLLTRFFEQLTDLVK